MGRLPDGTLNPTVVYSSFLHQQMVDYADGSQILHTKQAPMSAATAAWLKQGGVTAVVVGHQPVGDAPLYFNTHGVGVSYIIIYILIFARIS